MEDLVKVFNAQSSTTEVEMRYLEDSEYEDRLNKLLEEGGQADVIWLRQPSKSNRMAEAGQLFDLSQLVGGSTLDISKYGQSLDIVKLDEVYIPCPSSRISGSCFTTVTFLTACTWTILDR